MSNKQIIPNLTPDHKKLPRNQSQLISPAPKFIRPRKSESSKNVHIASVENYSVSDTKNRSKKKYSIHISKNSKLPDDSVKKSDHDDFKESLSLS